MGSTIFKSTKARKRIRVYSTEKDRDIRDIRIIRLRAYYGIPIHILAQSFGVSRETIHRVLKENDIKGITDKAKARWIEINRQAKERALQVLIDYLKELT